jgi:RNA polymerase sigma factor (sigma-70 family)
MALDSDQALRECLRGCVRGEKAAWDAFVERFAGAVFAAVRHTFRTHTARPAREEIEDTAQDVFVRLLKDDCRLLRTYDPARAAVVTWLTIVARSAALDRLRRRTLPTVALEHAAEPVDRAAPAAGPAEPGGALARVPSDLLSPRQRLVLALLFDQQMDVPAAARVMGVDEQTIRSTKNKAIQKLREHFGAGGGASGA